MRVLFLTHRLPYAPNRGDRLRAYHEIRLVSAHAEVHLASLVHDDDEASHVDDLRTMCASVTVGRVPWLTSRLRAMAALPGPRPLTHLLLDSPDLVRALPGLVERVRPDVVFAFCTGMARFALEAPLADLPLVLDFVDVDSAKWKALAETSSPPLKWIYAREHDRLARFEAVAARHARHNVVVNERELSRLQAVAPGARASVLPNGIDVDYFRPRHRTAMEPLVVFAGVMDYAPNVDGAVWLAESVWPLVRARVPGATLALVGAQPASRVRALAAADPSITVTGTVPDVRPWLWRAAVSAAPLHTAHGVQNKALEALAAGVRVVATTAVIDGLPRCVRPGCDVADGPSEFADALVARLQGRLDSNNAVAASHVDSLTWEQRMSRLPSILFEAAL